VRKARVPVKRRQTWTLEDRDTFIKAHPSGPLRDLFELGGSKPRHAPS
jgi:hypothetical protein